MRWQIPTSAALTVITLRLLYGCRAVTFAIWTNAALIGHAHPKLIVGTIELVISVMIFVTIFAAIKFIEFELDR